MYVEESEQKQKKKKRDRPMTAEEKALYKKTQGKLIQELHLCEYRDQLDHQMAGRFKFHDVLWEASLPCVWSREH